MTPIEIGDDELKEIFALFSAPTREEKDAIYRQDSYLYFRAINLVEEYSLTQEKREFAIDAWRAVLYFLHSKGYALTKDDKMISLSFSEAEFS